MLKNLLALIFITILVVGCNNQNQLENTKGPSITEERQEPGMMSSDELLRDARNEAIIPLESPATENGRAYISSREAKLKVKEYLKVTKQDSTSISYEGLKGEYYLFHASDLVHFNNKPEKLSRGWYTVNRNTGEVSSAKQ